MSAGTPCPLSGAGRANGSRPTPKRVHGTAHPQRRTDTLLPPIPGLCRIRSSFTFAVVDRLDRRASIPGCIRAGLSSGAQQSDGGFHSARANRPRGHRSPNDSTPAIPADIDLGGNTKTAGNVAHSSQAEPRIRYRRPPTPPLRKHGTVVRHAWLTDVVA